MRADWSEGKRNVTTSAELEALLTTLNAGEPTMLFLEHETGTILVAGFGAEETVLTFVQQDRTTLHSLGDPEREGFLEFRCGDHLDDFMAEMAVPAHCADEAVKQFFKSGTMPENVQWEADW